MSGVGNTANDVLTSLPIELPEDIVERVSALFGCHTATGSQPRRCLTDSRYSHSIASLSR